MAYQRYQLNITLQVQTPLITASSEPSALGMDVPMLKDHRGRYCFSGPLVQGRLLEECSNWPGPAFDSLKAMLGNATDGHDGAASTTGRGVVPDRKTLVFSDLYTETQPDAEQPALTRIALDPKTGTVKTGALQVLEQINAPGAMVAFKGHAYAYFASLKDAEEMAAKLQGALGLVLNFGADKGIDFGMNGALFGNEAAVTVEPAVAAHEKSWPKPLTEEMAVQLKGNTPAELALTLAIDRPFLISQKNPANNLFEGQSTVPGGVLKGAIAQAWLAQLDLKGKSVIHEDDDPQRPALAKFFSRLVIRHAFPSIGQERARFQPDSVVAVKKGAELVGHDLALTPDKVLIEGDAPKYAIDWKPDEVVLTPDNKLPLSKHFGWASPNTQLRVRTAIQSSTRAAKDNNLFAYQNVVPEQNAGDQATPRWEPILWHTRISLADIPEADRALVVHQLASLLVQGIPYLGKTKAVATVSNWQLTTSTPMREIDAIGSNNAVSLVLQTPAQLLGTNAVASATGHEGLKQAYVDYFDQASNRGLRLRHFFARQQLVGGYYQYRRFQAGPGAPNNTTYQPWLLTQPGAVFVFEVVNLEQARAALRHWLSKGLPAQGGTDWSSNPYQAANGYGEVQLNYPEHSQWQAP